MKKLLLLSVFSLLFVSSYGLHSRVFNSKNDAAASAGYSSDLPSNVRKLVDSDDTPVDNKVQSDSNFTVSAYDSKNKVLYLGESDTGKSDHSVVRVDFSSGAPVLKTLAGVGASELSNKKIDKLIVLPSGDLLVVRFSDGSDTYANNFYIIHNPRSDSPSLVTSPGLTDGAAAAARVIAISDAGQTSAGLDRIVVAVLDQANIGTLANGEGFIENDNAEVANAELQVFTYDGSAGTTPVLTAGRGQTEDGAAAAKMVLSEEGPNSLGHLLTGGTAGAAGNNIGGLSTPDVFTISSMHWNKTLKRLFIGTKAVGATAAHMAQVIVGRFGGDDTDADILFERFADISVANNETPVSMNKTGWAINHLDTIWDPIAKRYYLLVQSDQVASLGSIYAFPMVGPDDAIYNDDASRLGKYSTPDATTGVLQNPTVVRNGSSFGFFAGGVAPSRDVKALVGGYTFQNNNTMVSTSYSIYVHGQVVYLVLHADDANRPDVGIFASHPIYKSTGEIAGWSAWEKVVENSYYNQNGANSLGSAVRNIWIDDATGNVYYVAKNYDQTAATANEVGVLSWGDGDAGFYASRITPFLNKINSDFAATGVFTVANFPAITTVGLGTSGLTLVGSRDKVALMSTGALRSAGRVFNATLDASNVKTADRPYFVAGYSAAELVGAELDKHYKSYQIPGLGDVLCAEVARVTDANYLGAAVAGTPYPQTHGFVFVGGQGGLYVLSDDNGKGFNARSGNGTMGSKIEDMATVTAGTGGEFVNTTTPANQMSFHKIPNIDGPVHDLVCSGGYLYVMMAQKVLRIRLHAQNGAVLVTQNAVAEMFKSSMKVHTVPATEKLNALSASYTTDVTGNKFDNDVVVIQTVFDFSGTSEYFAHMTGNPNVGPLFIASNVGSGSNLYCLKHPGAVSCDSTYADVATVSPDGALANVFGGNIAATTADYKYSFSEAHIRRLAYRSINNWNGDLETYDSTGTPVQRKMLTVTGSSILLNGLYDDMGAVAHKTIGNLYVITGSIFKDSDIRIFDVRGNILGHVAGLSQLSQPYVVVKPGAVTDWLKADTKRTASVMSLPSLVNGLNFGGQPVVYQHAGGSTESDFVQTLSGGNDGSIDLTSNSANIPAGSFVFAMMNFANGARAAFGAPFGGTVHE